MTSRETHSLTLHSLDRLASMPGAGDEEVLFRLILHHRLGAACGAMIRLEEAPECLATLSSYRQDSLVSLAHAASDLDLHASVAVVRLAESFREEGIRLLLLKGPYLAHTLYGDPMYRPYADLDILVAPGDVEKASGILVRHGYQQEQAGWTRRIHFHLGFRPPESWYPPVELHWRPVDGMNLYRLAPDFLFRSARLWMTMQMPSSIFVPGLEDCFLYLCLHAAKHGLHNRRALRAGVPAEWYLLPRTGNCMLWFLDIALFMALWGHGVRWDQVVASMQDMNLTDAVQDICRIVHALYPMVEWPEQLSPAPLESRSGVATLPSPAFSAVNRAWGFRPGRLQEILPVLFPTHRELAQYYPRRKGFALAATHITHPFHIVEKVLNKQVR